MSPMRAQQDAGNSRGFSDSNEIKTQWFPLSASQATQRHTKRSHRDICIALKTRNPRLSRQKLFGEMNTLPTSDIPDMDTGKCVSEIYH